MHILHITPYYAPAWAFGGVVSAVSGLAAAQAARGHRVSVLTTDALDFTRRHPFPREVIDGVIVVRRRNISHLVRSRLNLSSPRRWRVAFDALQPPDVIHMHELRTVENLLTPHTAPIVLSPHGTLPYGTGRGDFKHLWDRFFGGRVLRKVDRVAALTTIEADEARALWEMRGVPFPGVSVLPNGIPADFAAQVTACDGGARALRARFGLGDGPVVLFLGRLHERKGLQFLIPAFASIHNAHPAAHLLIAGPDAGMRAQAEALARRSTAADRIIFAGMLEGDDRLAALRAADLFALPAVGEGQSIAALEAMAAGLALVLTPGCNLPELDGRGAGITVSRDADALAGALDRLLADANLRAQMGARGRAWVGESFTWPAIAAQSEHVYQEVRAGRSGP